MARIQHGNHVYDEETDQWFSFDSADEAAAYCKEGTHYVTPEVELRSSETIGVALLSVGSSPVMLLANDPNREQVHISNASETTQTTIPFSSLSSTNSPMSLVSGPGILDYLEITNGDSVSTVLSIFDGANRLYISNLPSQTTSNIVLPNSGLMFHTGLSLSSSTATSALYGLAVVSSNPSPVLIGPRQQILAGIGYVIPPNGDIRIRSRAELWVVCPAGTCQVSALTEFIQ